MQTRPTIWATFLTRSAARSRQRRAQAAEVLTRERSKGDPATAVLFHSCIGWIAPKVDEWIGSESPRVAMGRRRGIQGRPEDEKCDRFFMGEPGAFVRVTGCDCLACRAPTLRPHWSVKAIPGGDSQFGPSEIHTDAGDDPQAPQRLPPPRPGRALSDGLLRRCWERPLKPRAWCGLGPRCGFTPRTRPAKGSLPPL